MEPDKFFHEHQQPGRPVVFKGAAVKSAALEKWNDRYLTDRFGKSEIYIKRSKKERPALRWYNTNLEDFLSSYQKTDIHMATPVTKEMLGDIGLPKSLQCGGAETMLNQVFLLMNSGGTKSVLYKDRFETFECLLDGKIDLILINKDMAAVVEARGWVKTKDYSSINVENVDMLAFPKLQKLLWWKAEMEVGDCIYIPLAWYRQQTTSGRRVVGLKYWYYDPMGFDKKHCEDSEPLVEFGHLSLASFNRVASSESFRFDFFSDFVGKDLISKDDLKTSWNRVISDHQINEIMKHFDTDGDGFLQWQEVLMADIDWLTRTYGITHDVVENQKTVPKSLNILREGEEEGEEEYAIDLNDPQTIPPGYIREEL